MYFYRFSIKYSDRNCGEQSMQYKRTKRENREKRGKVVRTAIEIMEDDTNGERSRLKRKRQSIVREVAIRRCTRQRRQSESAVCSSLRKAALCAKRLSASWSRGAQNLLTLSQILRLTGSFVPGRRRWWWSCHAGIRCAVRATSLRCRVYCWPSALCLGSLAALRRLPVRILLAYYVTLATVPTSPARSNHWLLYSLSPRSLSCDVEISTRKCIQSRL